MEKARAYIQKALEAEEWASAATDPVLKEEWQNIAKNFQDLAGLRVRNVSTVATLNELLPSPASQASSQK